MVKPDAEAGRALMSLGDALVVVNLPARADRRAEMTVQLARLGLSFDHPAIRLFAAIRPEAPGGFSSIGARGAFESHLGVLRDARRDGCAAVIICEDDLDFAPDFPARIGPVASVLRDADWDILYAGCSSPTPQGAPSGLHPDILEIAPQTRVETTHFFIVRDSILGDLCAYLDQLRNRPPGDPAGGPMHVDGALCWFRAAHPGVRTLLVAPPLGHQRPSRTDIHDLRWFDRLPGVNRVADALRRVKRRLR